MEFWNYTPAEIASMLRITSDKRRRIEDREYARAYREAFLCALFSNIYRDEKKFPYPIPVSDFMFEYPKPAPRERVVMNDEEIEATLKNFVYPILKAAENSGGLQ
ncbi:MAG: hypothetical protein M0Q91_07730 [Methanoregula sp.]|nr:hypothetical protein [Methanoregula sp.]